MQYKIRWTSKITGKSGEGSGIFSKAEAEIIAKSLNKQPNAICNHRAVPAAVLKTKDYPGKRRERDDS